MAPRIGLTTYSAKVEERPVEALERVYVAAVVAAGAVPLCLPVLEPSMAETVVAGLDGILFSGGGDVDPAAYGAVPSEHLGAVDAERDAWEMALLRAGVARGLPMLGTCRGAQLMNVACGGTLVQHLPDTTDRHHCVKDQPSATVHPVRIDPGSRLRTVVGADALGTNSLHHQAVARVGDGLTAVAWADDGTIEAIEGTGSSRMIGVQWHPELMDGRPGHQALFAWLFREAGVPAPAPVVATPAA